MIVVLYSEPKIHIEDDVPALSTLGFLIYEKPNTSVIYVEEWGWENNGSWDPPSLECHSQQCVTASQLPTFLMTEIARMKSENILAARDEENLF